MCFGDIGPNSNLKLLSTVIRHSGSRLTILVSGYTVSWYSTHHPLYVYVSRHRATHVHIMHLMAVASYHMLCRAPIKCTAIRYILRLLRLTYSPSVADFNILFQAGVYPTHIRLFSGTRLIFRISIYKLCTSSI